MSSSAHSVIGANLEIIGDLKTDGAIQVDGVIRGDVRANKLVVSEKAQVEGEILATLAHVSGHVTGQIRAKDVKLSGSAKVTGDILHETLEVQPGAYLDGACRHTKNLVDPVYKADPLDRPALSKFAASGGRIAGLREPKLKKTLLSWVAADETAD